MRITAEHRRETASKTAMIALYGARVVAELLAGDTVNTAYREHMRYCELCERFYDAAYHGDFITPSLTDDLSEAEREGLDWCCCFCKERAKLLSEPKPDGSDVWLTQYPQYALRRLAEMSA